MQELAQQLKYQHGYGVKLYLFNTQAAGQKVSSASKTSCHFPSTLLNSFSLTSSPFSSTTFATASSIILPRSSTKSTNSLQVQLLMNSFLTAPPSASLLPSSPSDSCA